MANISVWVYDDLWEEGFRFGMSPMDGTENYYCYISRENAKDEHVAADYLATAFKFIPKTKGTSKHKQKAEILLSSPIVIINEDLYK